MKVNAIVACDINWGIGKGNELPWPRSDVDMKWFRSHTKGQIVVMGRKTWESLGSKPLPKRINIVVTTQDLMSNDVKPTATWTGDISACIKYLSNTYRGLDIWIMGGGDIYRQSIPLCDNVYLTRFHGEYECDTWLDRVLLDTFKSTTTIQATPECDFIIWSKQ